MIDSFDLIALDHGGYEPEDTGEFDLSKIDGGSEPEKLTNAELEAISGFGLIEGTAEKTGGKRLVSLAELNIKTGAGETYKMDTAKHAVDETIRKVMPDKITECSIAYEGKSTCADDQLANSIAHVIKSNAKTSSEIIADAKKQTGCTTEKCVVEKTIGKVEDEKTTKAILTRYFKVSGPTNTKLLSNVDIDTIMMQFNMAKPDFFPHPFNMRDYASNSFVRGEVVNSPDTLATITWEMMDRNASGQKSEELEMLPDPYANSKFKRCGCVINSDTYDGPGKHWMALYADWRTSPASIEFFNSAGNSPAAEFVNWMTKMKISIENAGGKAEIINASNIRHQHTRSECGVYSLFYIWARLNDVPVSYFQSNPIPDNVMFEFRQHLFSGSNYADNGAFDLNKFKAGVQIDWEPGHNDSA